MPITRLAFFVNNKIKKISFQAAEQSEVQYYLTVRPHDESFAEQPEFYHYYRTDHQCLDYGQTEESY